MPGALTNSPSEIIQTLLVEDGLAGSHDSTSWPATVNKEVDTPDNAITVIGTEWKDNGKVMQGERQGSHGIQIRVRSKNYPEGYTKADEIANALDPITLRSISVDSKTYRIQAITRTSGIIELGTDAGNSNREIFTINFLVSLRDVT